jgi:rare lipoprotein A
MKLLNAKSLRISIVYFLVLVSFQSKLFSQDSSSRKAVSTKSLVKRTYFGQASFYSNKFNGRETANGEIFSQSKMTCACNVLAMGTWIKVTNLRNDKSFIVKVNDRLHPSMKRIVDLSSAAAHKLGFTYAGLTRVKVEVLGKKKPK